MLRYGEKLNLDKNLWDARSLQTESSCEYKQNCRSQCMEIAATYNPNLKAR